MKALAQIIGALLVGVAAARAEVSVLISIPEQRMVVMDGRKCLAQFKVSTAKKGTGGVSGSKKTPLGQMRIAEKIGEGMKPGTVFYHRRPTSRIVKPGPGSCNAIITRILRLAGCERGNRNTESRGIYIHGTPHEERLGTPNSIGCVGMGSKDVIRLFGLVRVGTPVRITDVRISSVTSDRRGGIIAAR